MKFNNFVKIGLSVIIPITLSVGVFLQEKKITNLNTEISKTNIPSKKTVNKLMSQNDVKVYQKDIEKQLDNFVYKGILPENEQASNFMLKVFGLKVDYEEVSQSQLKTYMDNFSYEIKECFGKYNETNDNQVDMILKLAIKQGNNKIETVAPYLKVTLDASNGNILNGTFYQAESDGE